MDILNPKERLLRVLKKENTDRPPIICPGGMMNAAIVEVMNKTGHILPDAHKDDLLMSELAVDVHANTGFENFGVPFCMTVEAEVLGSSINIGTLGCEPKIQKEAFPSVSKIEYKNINDMLKSGRINTIVQAGYRLSKKYPDVPVIGNLTGPISNAASVVEPMTFLKELRKDKVNSHKLLDYISDFLIEYSKLMIDNGASVISIADPTSTGEILGPRVFEEYSLKYLNKIVDAIHHTGTPVIVHICGKMDSVRNFIPEIKSDAISTDAFVNLKLLKEDYPTITTMGNLSTFLLELGTPDTISKQTERLVKDGINIISPACGLSTATTLNNLHAMTSTVKEHS